MQSVQHHFLMMNTAKEVAQLNTGLSLAFQTSIYKQLQVWRYDCTCTPHLPWLYTLPHRPTWHLPHTMQCAVHQCPCGQKGETQQVAAGGCPNWSPHPIPRLILLCPYSFHNLTSFSSQNNMSHRYTTFIFSVRLHYFNFVFNLVFKQQLLSDEG